MSAGVRVLEQLWESRNRRWRILLVETTDAGSHGAAAVVRDRLMVENVKTGETQFPIRYWDGRVGWDNPYVIPAFVVDRTEQIMRKRIKFSGLPCPD